MKGWRCCRGRVSIICSLHFCRMSMLGTAEMLLSEGELSIEEGRRDLASSKGTRFCREHHEVSSSFEFMVREAP